MCQNYKDIMFYTFKAESQCALNVYKEKKFNESGKKYSTISYNHRKICYIPFNYSHIRYHLIFVKRGILKQNIKPEVCNYFQMVKKLSTKFEILASD